MATLVIPRSRTRLAARRMAPPGTGPRARAWSVREPEPPRVARGDEEEGDTRVLRASAAIGADAWWSASLTLPVERDPEAETIAFLRVERHGAPRADYRGDVEAGFSVPAPELDTVVGLLARLVAMARREGSAGSA